MPRAAVRYFTVDAIVAIHEQVLQAHGGAPGIRDMALLESAVAAPKASHAGKPLMKHPIEIAAAYLFYLCRNHPFVDGNKRTGLAACLVFLDSLGLLPGDDGPAAAVDAWEAMVIDVAASRIDRRTTTARLRALLRRPRR